MTLNIEIPTQTGATYRITSNDMQIVIQRKKLVDPKKSPAFKPGMNAEPYEKFEDWKFCGNVTRALDIIAEQDVFDSDATELAQLRNEIASFRREIRRLMGEVE